jgi:hypothetical protein
VAELPAGVGSPAVQPAPGGALDRRVVRALFGAALLVAAAGVAAVVIGDGGSAHPSRWDDRVLDLVAFVEEERGLEFAHPVHIDFLAEDEFREVVTEHEELDDQELAELQAYEAVLRAVGLASGAIDLLDVHDTLLGEGVVGLYRFEDQRIVLRGQELDDHRRSTLVHELTHALQDQHFGIGDLEPATSGEAAALLAVIEADAVLVEDAWRATLPDRAQEQLDAGEAGFIEDMDLDGVPEVFVELMSFPYVFGPAFLEAVIEERGQEGRDAAFVDPPTTEQHIVLPATYLDGRAPREVPSPDLAPSEEAIPDTEDDFGMLSLLVVLAERVEYSTSWAAVQGWAGDAMVAFHREGRVCIRVDVAFDAESQAARFAATFAEWAAGMPAAHHHDGDTVRFESCDPGVEADQARAAGHVSGIQGLGLRLVIAESFAEDGVDGSEAYCIADGMIAELTANRVLELDEVLDPDDLDHPGWDEVRHAVLAALAECG